MRASLTHIDSIRPKVSLADLYTDEAGRNRGTMGRTGRVRLLASFLALAFVLTVVLLALDAALSPRIGLRHQVWQLSEQTRLAGPLLVDEIVSQATLGFLDRTGELPRRFFRSRWEGYWDLPGRQEIEIHGAGDDRLDVWINDTLAFRYPPRSAARPVAHTITLDRGVHSLRVEYEQYGGTTGMRLEWAPHGEPRRAFDPRRLFPEPPDAADRFLASAVFWLRHIVVLAWLVPIPVALLLLTRRSTVMEAPDHRTDPMTCTLARHDIALVAGLCAVMFVYGVGNLSLKQTADDGTQNLALGLRLIETGQYGLEDRDAFREPFPPAVWGVANVARELLGFQRVSHDCVATRTPPCAPIYSYLKIVNLAFLLAGAAVAFLLVHRFTSSTWLAAGTFLLTAQNGQLLVSTDRFYTEPHAATLLIVTAFLVFRVSDRRRMTDGLLLGLTLAALVLTKVVFVYLWIFIALALVASDALNHRLGRSTVIVLSVFLASHFLFWSVPGWPATRPQSAVLPWWKGAKLACGAFARRTTTCVTTSLPPPSGITCRSPGTTLTVLVFPPRRSTASVPRVTMASERRGARTSGRPPQTLEGHCSPSRGSI